MEETVVTVFPKADFRDIRGLMEGMAVKAEI
jgi:hypothetical protein